MSPTSSVIKVPGGEAGASLPVVERDAHFVVARRQGADVDFPAQRDVAARANAGVGLGNALAGTQVDDVDGE